MYVDIQFILKIDLLIKIYLHLVSYLSFNIFNGIYLIHKPKILNMNFNRRYIENKFITIFNNYKNVY